MTLDLEVEEERKFEEIVLDSMPQFINQGGEGCVYDIGGGKALKLMNWPIACLADGVERDSGDVLLHEYRMMQQLFDEDIKVPVPYGVYDVKIPGVKHYKRGLVMEFIDGELLFRFKRDSLVRLEGEKLMVDELEKARRKGFMVSDEGSYNTIWIPKKRDIVLVDFTAWNRIYSLEQ